MANGNGKTEPGAPYLPWGTFEKFLKGLKQKGTIPPRIDGSLLTSYSGTVQSQLRGALRFFGLVDGEHDHTTPELHAWVNAVSDRDKWRTVLGRAVPENYRRVVADVDLASGTQALLEEAFRTKGGAAGSAKKAARFFLTAMSAAGLEVSPYFANVRAGDADSPAGSPGASTGKKRRSKRSSQNTGEGATMPMSSAPEGTRKIDLPIPGGTVATVWWPVELNDEQEAFALDTLTRYLKIERSKKDGTKGAGANEVS